MTFFVYLSDPPHFTLKIGHQNWSKQQQQQQKNLNSSYHQAGLLEIIFLRPCLCMQQDIQFWKKL